MLTWRASSVFRLTSSGARTLSNFSSEVMLAPLPPSLLFSDVLRYTLQQGPQGLGLSTHYWRNPPLGHLKLWIIYLQPTTIVRGSMEQSWSPAKDTRHLHVVRNRIRLEEGSTLNIPWGEPPEPVWLLEDLLTRHIQSNVLACTHTLISLFVSWLNAMYVY